MYPVTLLLQAIKQKKKQKMSKKTTSVATVKAVASKAEPTKSTTTSSIGRTKVLPLITKNGKGKIFSITNNTRKFTCRLSGPKDARPLRRGANIDVATLGHLRVWDVFAKNWRTVNLQTVTELRTGGKVYKVR